MAIILREESANSLSIPPSGKTALFVDDSGTVATKNDVGTVTTFPTVNSSNTQVVYTDGSALAGASGFTFDNTSNQLSVSGNIVAGNVKTDNLLYANGTPWDLEQPAGSNNQIQYNLDNDFAASANFTYNDSTQLLSVVGNISSQNANLGNLITANFISGTLITGPQTNITSVGTLIDLAVSGNTVIGGNLVVNGNTTFINVETLDVEDPLISIGGGPNNQPLESNDGKDRGLLLKYFSTQPVTAFMGWDNSNNEFALGSNVSVSGDVVSFNSVGNLRLNQLIASDANLGNLATANFVSGTLTTNAQPNVTSLGTLSSLDVSGNGTFGNVYANSGTIGASLLTGTLTTAAQPNVTSVGTLTGLAVNGNITAANITANTGVFTGNGSGLSAIAGANVTGTVANATHSSTANTVVDSAQPNITSVGTLTSLAITGNLSAGNISTGGVLSVTGNANVGNLGATGVVATTLGGTLTTAAQPNITSVGTLSSLSVTGNANVGNIGAANAVFTGTGSFGGNVAMGNFNITSLATPVNSTDAATKAYVDGVAEGLHTHDSCNAATTGTLATLSSGTVTYNNGTDGVGATLTTTGSYTTIDGVTLQNGMRILVKNEANAAHNGIYDRTSSTVLTRSSDFDTPTEMAGGDFTFVNGGTLYDNTGWVMPDPVTTVGTTDVNWVQFSGAGTYTAGTGLTLTGTVFSVNASQTQITSVGTLTGLNVNGTVTASAFTANTGVFTGNGSGLSAIAGGNVTGQVANALVAGTVYTAAQPNITSVGTLTSLAVTGNASAGNISTGGALSVTGNANVGNIGAAAGVFTSVSGNGSALTALNASNISSGTLAQARLANSTLTLGSTTLTLGATTTTVAGLSSVTSTTFVGALTGAATTAGTVTTAAQPNITSVGTLTSLAVTGNVSAGNIVCTGVIGGAGADLTGNILTTGANTTAGTVTGNWTLSAGSRWNATYADLAEKYVADANYEPGTVLVFGGEHEVTAANEFDSTRVAGVVSTDPAYIMNAGCEGEHVAVLALQGRVPCKVHGPVAKGDLMVAGQNGHAVANNMARAGTIIGKALENFEGGSGVIEVVVGRF